MINERFCKLFDTDFLQKLAFETKFYKRAGGKISPYEFIDILLHAVSCDGYLTLNQSAIEQTCNKANSISKQGIDQRFTKEAIRFIETLVKEAINSQISILLNPQFLKSFKQVRIKDATRFDLPEQLAEHYKGFGGRNTSDAAICIQYEFDLKTLKFIYIKLTSANKPDVKESLLKDEFICENDLFIRDMGYFNLENFNLITQKNAYFISRLKSTVVVWENLGERICFKSLYKHMLQTRQLLVEKDVYLGEYCNHKARIIIQLVSDEIYAKRIQRLEAIVKKNGRKLTDEAKYRARFWILITNISSQEIEACDMYNLYRLRWQIELLFKSWKSNLGIQKVQKMKYERFTCLIYAKLLYIILSMEIISHLRKIGMETKQKLLSIDKCFKTLILYKIFLVFFRKATNPLLEKNIKNILKIFEKNHWQEKRKNRENLEDILSVFY